MLLRALVYDELQGNYSVGAAVRDAACYVCWAFARAYQPDHFRQYALQVAPALLCVALFDREVLGRVVGQGRSGWIGGGEVGENTWMRRRGK